MRRSSRTARVLAVSLVASAALAACSSGGSGGGGGGSDKPTDSTIASFTYCLEAIPPTLDVANNYSSADMAVMGLATQPLEIPNLDGTFTPVLATKVSQPDATTIVYDLRDDVTFSDGSPLTPDDVIWTLGHLQGESTQTATELTNVKEVRATGDHQVTMTLNGPNPALRGSFALISFIQQKAYGEKSGKELGTSKAPPIGTGPYVIDSYTSNKITMKRNPEFTGKKPAVDAFTFTAISDDNAGQLAMRSGELDGIAVNDIKTTSRWKTVEGATTYSSPTLYLDYILMNTKVKPFDDVHVRRAVAYATDVKGLLSANYGDQASASIGLTPPEVLTPVEPTKGAFKEAAEAATQHPFKIAEAKKELALSAHPEGFTATFEYYSPAGKLVGVSLAENLKKIGITLELESRRINDFIGDLYVGKGPDIGFFSIAAVVPDPSSWYLYLVGADNPYNAARYSTPATAQALKDIDQGDKAQRWAASKTVIDAMAEDVPYVGLAQPNFVFALAKGMTFDNTPDFIESTSGNWVNHLKSTK